MILFYITGQFIYLLSFDCDVVLCARKCKEKCEISVKAYAHSQHIEKERTPCELFAQLHS
jgi:hypothetical protein